MEGEWDRVMERDFHSYSVEETVRHLETHLARGLTGEEAQERLMRHGPNELTERPPTPFWKMVLEQLNNFLVLLLLGAALVSLFLGELVDAVAIIAIVIINAILGVIQESRAEHALRALKKLASPTARVMRDGRLHTLPARDLVVGDIVLLEAGNYVPADLRLYEAANLTVEEASLTGESVPVEKKPGIIIDKETPLGDRVNTAFMGTLVTYGRGKGIVTATGMHTQIGLIARMISSYEEEETPLQRRLAQLGRWLGSIILLVCGVVFLIGFIRDPGMGKKEVIELFMTAVSLAIAAVPEGLPAIVTICLALGMQRMVKRNALLRRLPAVETLGAVTVICSDKTGTLTQNKMMVVQLCAGGMMVEVTGKGYEPRGEFLLNGRPINLEEHPVIRLLLQGGMLCNDARLEALGQAEEKGQAWRMVGDPTEGALVIAAAKAGLWKEEVEASWPRTGEVPFDSDRKRMTTIHKNPATGESIAYVKGAPDIVLTLCDSLRTNDGVRPLTEEGRKEILAANERMASDALRVLGLAYKEMGDFSAHPRADRGREEEEVEKGLIFIGLIGMIDPARPEVAGAVLTCRQAGIMPVMITGDYKNTAVAIATDLGLVKTGQRVLTGVELDRLTDEEFMSCVEEVSIYARVSPSHKVRIVEALKARGQIVAMTGDGVNDAPALKRASIGVAMGITGTDVAKETADMVLTDDNFASIVSAVEEGRIIYSNIRKFVSYLLSCNVGEILTIFIAEVLGLPLPLRPIHLLWLNLLTDGLPALALGVEKGDPGIMACPPRPPGEPIINREMRVGIIMQSCAIAGATLGAFLIGLRWFGGHLQSAQTMAFTTLTMAELLRAYTSRSEHSPLYRIGFLTNRSMVGATLLSFLLLVIVIYLPALDPVFYTTPLGLMEWFVLLPLISVPALVAEATKILRMRRKGDGVRS